MLKNKTQRKDDCVKKSGEIVSDGVESLIEINGSDVKLYKNKILKVDSFVACLGPPGSGKSSFCSSYYKHRYKAKEIYFIISDSLETYTKGLWILKEEQRRKIREPIKRDVIDVEGFQVDQIKSWKYVMVCAFLATDIILINRNARIDDLKKVIKIIGSSIEKMKSSNIPRILKTICIQVPKKQYLSPAGFKKLIDVIEDKTLEQLEGIELKPFYIPQFTEEELELVDDITEYPKYQESFKQLFEMLTPENMVNSVSTLNTYIDNFNGAINGINGFNIQAIMEDLKSDFNAVYSRFKNKHRNFLLSKREEYKKVDDLNETFEDFVNKQNLDFSFTIDRKEYTFYGSSEDFDKKYEEFEKEKDFKIDPEEIFRDIYESQKEEIKYKNDANKSKYLQKVNKKKADIDNYFSQLPFYAHIDPTFDFKIESDDEVDNDFKLEQEKELKAYYENATNKKRESWKEQIERAKWKCIVQAYGDLTCENGCKLKDNVVCGDCLEQLYWVDGDARYVICKKCGDSSVRKISEKLICSGCKARSKAEVKWVSGYKP